ncbi:hypothetical protein B2J93_9480 [Marssonina coronariae]|uniref:Uncharacterized protein n=1 Tax=Diplocarpon coronariae TaxID=2795749 RepID=A0A218YW96_9HELO|nr:hypothetical protein B2J93_9480 [Marssonina coronariae]
MRDATRPGQVAEVTEFGLALYKSYIKELLDCDLIEEGRTHLNTLIHCYLTAGTQALSPSPSEQAAARAIKTATATWFRALCVAVVPLTEGRRIRALLWEHTARIPASERRFWLRVFWPRF